MIRPIAALTRQVQDMFHQHLAGIVRWDSVEFKPRERNVNPAPDTWAVTKRGRRIRPERLEGKYHAVLHLQFGIYDMTVAGPNEHPPLGLVKLDDGDKTIEGPLDPTTWQKIAEHIKNQMENNDGYERCASPSNWG